jgi:hypothetical protein
MDPLRNLCWISYGRLLYTWRLLVFEINSSFSIFWHIFIFQQNQIILSRLSSRGDENYQSLHRIRKRSLEGLKKSDDPELCLSEGST